MNDIATGAKEQETGENSISMTVIFLADVVLPEAITRAYGGHIPRDTLRQYMTMLLNTVGQHNGRVLRKTETAVTASFDDPTEAVKAAINLQVQSSSERTEDLPLAVRVAVDYAWSDTTRRGEGSFDDKIVRMSQSLDGGGALVSKAIRSNVTIEGIEFKEVQVRNESSRQPILFYRPEWKDDRQYLPGSSVQRVRFIHAGNLVRGDRHPCFYCGSRRHEAAKCPSKILPQITHGLSTVGSMTISAMNEAFQRYLAQGSDDPQKGQKNHADHERPSAALSAHYAFYELTRVFQLRFLNAVWDPQEHNSWLRIRNSDRMPLTGGKLRLAFDCLRTFQLDQAEEVLKAAEWTTPRDFRFNCLMGFVNVERVSLTMATHFFTKAYEYAHTVPQKIYALLLRYRACVLDGKKRQAEDVLSLCLSLDPNCPEAIFEDVINKSDSDKGKAAGSLLDDLVTVSNEYWTAGIISPDLSLHFDTVGPELHRMLEDVRKEGKEYLKYVDDTLANLRRMLNEDDGDLTEMSNRYLELQEKGKTDTFFGWRDITRAAPQLVAACTRMAFEHQNMVRREIQAVAARLSLVSESGHASQPSLRVRLRAIDDDIQQAERDLNEWHPHEEILSRCVLLAKQMDEVEARISILGRADRRIVKARGFVKDFAIFLGIASVSAAALTIGSMSLLKSIPSVSAVLSNANLGWVFDGMVILVLVASLFFALVRSISDEEPTGAGPGRHEPREQSRGPSRGRETKAGAFPSRSYLPTKN